MTLQILNIKTEKIKKTEKPKKRIKLKIEHNFEVKQLDFLRVKLWTLFDPFFYSFWIEKLCNRLMLSGKKHYLEIFFLENMMLLKKKKKKSPFFFLLEIIELAKPSIEVIGKRRGNLFFQVPFPLWWPRQYKLSLFYIIIEIRQKSYSKFRKGLFFEILHVIYTRNSKIFDTLNRLYKKSVIARDYMHYRWRN